MCTTNKSKFFNANLFISKTGFHITTQKNTKPKARLKVDNIFSIILAVAMIRFSSQKPEKELLCFSQKD